MIRINGAEHLHKIVVLNPKGGCGKTTLVTNVASCYAERGPPPTLIDCDPQGFCLRWLEKRPAARPAIHGVKGYSETLDAADTLVVDVPEESRVVILDLPAGIPHARLHDYTYWADSVLLPIMPSDIDVYSATRFIAELLLDAQLDRRDNKLAIVASRVRTNTKSYRMLFRFLTSLKIPMVATLRDSQSFVYAAAQGIGLSELPAYRIKDDLAQIDSLMAWLERRRPVSARERETMIANAAYRIARDRGFDTGDSVADWLEAEREVDAALEHQA